MRTTLTLDEDVAQTVKDISAESKRSLKNVINQALRSGLQQVKRPPRQSPYQTVPRPLGLRDGYSLDNIQELLANIAGEDKR